MKPKSTAMKTPENGGERARQGEGRTLAPPVDVLENEDELLILADFPGVSGESLNVHVDGSELTLEGRPDGSDAILRRSFHVPNTIDPGQIAAETNDGVLRVRLPKRKDAKPRRIEVRSA